MLLDEHRTSPEWRCWLAHVAHLRYCLRRTYPLSAPQRVQELNDEFLAKFALTRWAEWSKPKWHLPEHFADALKEDGPFRGNWCMSYEGFVQLLKQMFHMGSYQNAPVQVLEFWLCKAILRWRNQRRSSWREFVVECDEVAFRVDWDVYKSTTLLGEAVALKHATPASFRIATAVCRGDDFIRLGDKVLVQDRDKYFVGRIDEILQLVFALDTQSVVRFWLSDVRTAIMATDDSIQVDATALGRTCMLSFEDTHDVCTIHASTVRSTAATIVYLY